MYDSVHTFLTGSVGVRTAVCRLRSGVTLRGMQRSSCVIDHTGAEYGIICENVSAASAVRNLTIKGGIGRDAGREDDGDGRNLVTAIMCLKDASPTIENVTIKESATGIVAREGCAPTIRRTVIARGSHHGIYVYMNGASPVVIDRLTAVQNFDVGVYVYSGTATIASSCITHSGKPGVQSYECAPSVVVLQRVPERPDERVARELRGGALRPDGPERQHLAGAVLLRLHRRRRIRLQRLSLLAERRGRPGRDDDRRAGRRVPHVRVPGDTHDVGVHQGALQVVRATGTLREKSRSPAGERRGCGVSGVRARSPCPIGGGRSSAAGGQRRAAPARSATATATATEAFRRETTAMVLERPITGSSATPATSAPTAAPRRSAP